MYAGKNVVLPGTPKEYDFMYACHSRRWYWW